MVHNLRASILMSLFTLTACGPGIDDLAPLPSLTIGDTASSSSSGSTSSSSTGGGSTSEGAEGSASSAAGSSSGSTSGDSSTGDQGPPACFAAACSDDMPCGPGLVCKAHPDGGDPVCVVPGCIKYEPCDGDAYACTKDAPQAECLPDASGHGWCHPKRCKEGWYCEAGECVAGLCY